MLLLMPLATWILGFFCHLTSQGWNEIIIVYLFFNLDYSKGLSFWTRSFCCGSAELWGSFGHTGQQGFSWRKHGTNTHTYIKFPKLILHWVCRLMSRGSTSFHLVKVSAFHPLVEQPVCLSRATVPAKRWAQVWLIDGRLWWRPTISLSGAGGSRGFHQRGSADCAASVALNVPSTRWRDSWGGSHWRGFSPTAARMSNEKVKFPFKKGLW